MQRQQRQFFSGPGEDFPRKVTHGDDPSAEHAGRDDLEEDVDPDLAVGPEDEAEEQEEEDEEETVSCSF
jgi:hypothetical protein